MPPLLVADPVAVRVIICDCEKVVAEIFRGKVSRWWGEDLSKLCPSRNSLNFFEALHRYLGGYALSRWSKLVSLGLGNPNA